MRSNVNMWMPHGIKYGNTNATPGLASFAHTLQKTAATCPATNLHTAVLQFFKQVTASTDRLQSHANLLTGSDASFQFLTQQSCLQQARSMQSAPGLPRGAFGTYGTLPRQLPTILPLPQQMSQASPHSSPLTPGQLGSQGSGSAGSGSGTIIRQEIDAVGPRIAPARVPQGAQRRQERTVIVGGDRSVVRKDDGCLVGSGLAPLNEDGQDGLLVVGLERQRFLRGCGENELVSPGSVCAAMPRVHAAYRDIRTLRRELQANLR